MNKWFRVLRRAGMIFGIVFTIFFTIYGIRTGIFSSSDALKKFLDSFGVFADPAFILLQAFQVVVPIIPGAVSLLAGVIIFGSVKGFIYNYIGICAGSIIAFSLTRHFGMPLLESVSSRRMLNKYKKWLFSKKFDRLFAAAIFFPVAPDDFLCYLAGVSHISYRKFILIILAGKPLSILIYSLGLDYFLRWILQILKSL